MTRCFLAYLIDIYSLTSFKQTLFIYLFIYSFIHLFFHSFIYLIILFIYQFFFYSSDDSHYLSSIEESGWLHEISVLLDYAMCIAANLTNDNSSVLIAIGSGTERVAQVCLFTLFIYIVIASELISNNLN